VKLLLYSHAFPPSVGGVETIVASLASGLATVPAPKNAPAIQVTVVTQTPAGKFDDASFPFQVVRQPGFLALARLIRAADVVHIAGPALAPMFLSWLLRKPYLVEHHGYQAICPNGILLQQPELVVCPGHFQAGHYRKCIKCESQGMPWLRAAVTVPLNILRHSLARRAATNVAVSQHVARRTALPRTVVIYHGLESDPSKFPQPDVTPVKSANTRFGYVGRFVPEKGLSILLDAAQHLRSQRQDFEVVLVGDGPQRPQIESSIRCTHSGDFIRITGFLSGDKLANTVNSLDVVVMPSIWEETAGLAAIEQMTRGRLVIAADIGGLGEVVGDAGLKFPAGDAGCLADQMSKVIQGNAQISDLGRIARQRSQSRFCKERMIAEHMSVYSWIRPKS
jgi:glycosyltransferase involved in cell wall biosynthesis